MKIEKNILWAVALGLSLAGVQAGEWGNWRGPNHNGSTEEKDLPAKFSKTQGVIWSAPMPGPSAATPIVFGDHVFLSSSNPEEQQLMASCHDRKTGALKWKHVVAHGHNKDNRSNYAAPSPVTDGQLVSFYYGNGALATYTTDGKKMWAKNIEKQHGEFAYQWTPSSSPLLHNGTLYLQVLQRNSKVHGRGRDNGKSYILGLDPKTGGQLWKVYRTARAKAESLEAYSTPVPFTHGGREEILITGGDCITGHDPKSGAELWRWGTWNPTRIGHWR
ncbi:MAG: PQQ-binding-like beta-propeller repeat protein, partial [Verrucomicrobia bacterium]|nr:PQQ-binding-like beta-propeller repeat protein [Verrucomicrobiota bacterium]